MNPAGKTALVTGANSGLGKAISRALAAAGARVFMLVRDQARGQAARAEIAAATGNPQLEVIVCDLARQRDIHQASAAIHSRADALHLLVNNAGTAFRDHGLTEDGIERTLAVDHLAPFLLTNLLLDRLQAEPPARIVNVGTRYNTRMVLDDLNWQHRRYRMLPAYGQAKLGNIHFTRELARRLAGSGVTVNCVFPGVFRSNLGGTDGAQGPFWRAVALLLGWALPSADKAAQRVMYVLTDAEVATTSGLYFGDRKPLDPPAQAKDPAMNAEVWRLSETLVQR